MQYQQQAPPYDPRKADYGNAEQGYGGGPKQDFSQAFHIDKPKYHDIWAAILFLATCAGFVAVSGIAIQGYGLSV